MVSTNALPDATAREVESFVTEWLADERVPGASVAVVDGGDLVYAEGFGARDLETNAPATADTLYGVGSVTKSFTALAVMQLVEAGALDVGDAVDEYVPYLDDVPGDPVTIAELLAHSSGMPSDASAVALISRAVGDDPVAVPLSGRGDFERHLRATADDRVTDGERFFYYNSGYTVLGAVVEAVDGRPFEEYVDEEILQPLGMARSTFSRADFEAADDAMTPYRADDDRPVATEFPFNEIVPAPGGLVSSVTELADYLAANTAGGSHEGVALLDDALLAEMHDRHATRAVGVDGTDHDYGYGWMVSEHLGDTLVGHGGSIAVSTAYIGFLEDADLGVAVLCNTAPEVHPMQVGPALLALLEGQEPREAVPAFGLREKLEAVTGTYESHAGVVTATVERAGGGLELTIESALSEQALSLLPETATPDDHAFRGVTADGERVPVEFDVSDDGTDLYVQRWRLREV